MRTPDFGMLSKPVERARERLAKVQDKAPVEMANALNNMDQRMEIIQTVLDRANNFMPGNWETMLLARPERPPIMGGQAPTAGPANMLTGGEQPDLSGVYLSDTAKKKGIL